MKYIYVIILLIKINCNLVAQQPLVGRVVDAVSGINIAGVSLKSVNGQLLSSSNSIGIFIIPNKVNLPMETKVFAMGYDTVLVQLVASKDTFLIKMNKSKIEIEEIIVSTGYQKIPKERSTGSFSYVSNEDLNTRGGSNILSRLEDKVTGLHFNKQNFNFNQQHQESDFLVHGYSSILSNTLPLIVLDGFPFEGDLSDINPNDVKDVTVLKDAAASSIWGARAGNGVIVINTFNGTKDKQLNIRYGQTIEFSEKPNLYKAPFISPSDFIDLEQYLYGEGYYTEEFSKSSRPAVTPVVQLMYDKEQGKLTEEEFSITIGNFKKYDVRDEFMKYFYRNPLVQQYNLSMNGGTEKIDYYFGGGYNKDIHSLRSNSSSRYTFRNNNTIKMGRFIEIQTNIALNNLNNSTYPTYAPTGYGNIKMGSRSIYPYARFEDEEGNRVAIPFDYNQSYLDDLHVDGLLDWNYNPVDDLVSNSKHENNLSTQLGFTGLVKLAKSWNFSMAYQYQKSVNKDLSDYKSDSYYARNMINRFTSINDDGSLIKRIPEGSIRDRTDYEKTSSALRSQVDYDLIFDNNHSLVGLVGFEIRDVQSNSYSSRIYGFDEKTTDFQPVDYVSRFPIFDRLGGNVRIPYNSNIIAQHNRFVSLYGNVSYSYQQKYTLTGSVRRDASNLFGVATNQKWSPFWSLGIGIDALSNWYRGKFINRLKVRATLGYNGNIDPSRSGLLKTTKGGIDSNTGMLYYYIESAPDYHMRWEKVRTINLGVDYSFWENNIFGSIDIYKKRTSDLFGYQPMDPTTGFYFQYLNKASTHTNGVDIDLGAKIEYGAVKWYPSLKFSYSKNILDSYTPSTSSTFSNFPFLEGEILHPLVSLPFKGLDPQTGDPLGFFNNEISTDYTSLVNNVSPEHLIVHGSEIPQNVIAFAHKVQLKRFSLFLNFTGHFNYFFRRTGFYSNGINTMDVHTDYLQRWQQEGDEKNTDIPSFRYPLDSNRETFYRISSALVEPGDHVRLQDIRVDYNLDLMLHRKIGVELYGNIHNVGILWKKTEIDIDPMTANSWIPSPRTVTVGLNLNF